MLRVAERCRVWHPCTALQWRGEHYGRCVRVDADRSRIELHGKGRFSVSFTANLRAEGCGGVAAVTLQMVKKHQRSDLFTVYGDLSNSAGAATVTMSGVIVENIDHASTLLLCLDSCESLTVEDAFVTIIEL